MSLNKEKCSFEFKIIGISLLILLLFSINGIDMKHARADSIVEEPDKTPRITNDTDQRTKISQELLNEMDKAPDDTLQIIIQSNIIITKSEEDQISLAGVQILNKRDSLIVAKATSEQIKNIESFEWISLISLDVLVEALETPLKTETPTKTPTETPKTPFITNAVAILALLLLTIRYRRKNNKGGL